MGATLIRTSLTSGRVFPCRPNSGIAKRKPLFRRFLGVLPCVLCGLAAQEIVWLLLQCAFSDHSTFAPAPSCIATMIRRTRGAQARHYHTCAGGAPLPPRFLVRFPGTDRAKERGDQPARPIGHVRQGVAHAMQAATLSELDSAGGPHVDRLEQVQ